MVTFNCIKIILNASEVESAVVDFYYWFYVFTITFNESSSNKHCPMVKLKRLNYSTLHNMAY